METLTGSHSWDGPIWENVRRPSSAWTGSHTSVEKEVHLPHHIILKVKVSWLISGYRVKCVCCFIREWVVSVSYSLNPIYIFMSPNHWINFCCLFSLLQIIASKNWVQLSITLNTANFSFVYEINSLFNLLPCCTGLNIYE